MPVTIDESIHVLNQEQFGQISFDVIGHAFAIHNEMGRFFEEHVYQNELRRRLGGRASTEVCIHVTHGDFHKPYRLDLLVDHGAVFELKAAQELHDQHRNQLIHYLMLTGLAHGKLINFRPEAVEHKFVNCSLSLEERRAFRVQTERWDARIAAAMRFQEVVVGFLRDWGTCLDLQLYEEAVTHFFGGPELVNQQIDVVCQGHRIGRQVVRLIDPATAFKLTALRRDLDTFESHTRRFLDHTELQRVLWANITVEEVVFVVISK